MFAVCCSERYATVLRRKNNSYGISCWFAVPNVDQVRFAQLHLAINMPKVGLLALAIVGALAQDQFTLRGANDLVSVSLDGCYTITDTGGASISDESVLISLYTRDGEYESGPVLQVRGLKFDTTFGDDDPFRDEWGFFHIMGERACDDPEWTSSSDVLIFTDDMGNGESDEAFVPFSENWYISYDGGDSFARITNEITVNEGCGDEEGSTSNTWSDDAVSESTSADFSRVVPSFSLDVLYDSDADTSECDSSDGYGSRRSTPYVPVVSTFGVLCVALIFSVYI